MVWEQQEMYIPEKNGRSWLDMTLYFRKSLSSSPLYTTIQWYAHLQNVWQVHPVFGPRLYQHVVLRNKLDLLQVPHWFSLDIIDGPRFDIKREQLMLSVLQYSPDLRMYVVITVSQLWSYSFYRTAGYSCQRSWGAKAKIRQEENADI